MKRVTSYRELEVYREAFSLAMQLFEVVRGYPPDEQYDQVRQTRRSSRSVCANVAEAWRRRMYPASLTAKLIDAEAEAAETRVHLEFAEACHYIDAATRSHFDRAYDRLLARLTRMRERPDRWMPRGRRTVRGTAVHSQGSARRKEAGPGKPAPAANHRPAPKREREENRETRGRRDPRSTGPS